MMTKIKSKMTLSVSALVFSLMTVTALTSLLYFEREIKASITGQQYTLASSLASVIDGRLVELHEMVKALAVEITPEMLAAPEKGQKFFDARISAHETFTNGLFLFDPSGRLIAAYPPSKNLIGADYSFRGYLKKTLVTGIPQISEPFLSRQVSAVPMIMFTAPVRDAAGQVIAVIGGGIDLFR